MLLRTPTTVIGEGRERNVVLVYTVLFMIVVAAGFLLSDYGNIPISSDYTSQVLGFDQTDVGYDVLSTSSHRIIVGWTDSTTIPGTHLGTPSQSIDVLLTIIPLDQSPIRYLTIGGTGIDLPYDTSIDSQGFLLIGGLTSSPDFPTQLAEDSSFEIVDPADTETLRLDGFLMKLDFITETIVWSTFLGGFGSDYITGLAVDESDNIYVSGFTTSLDSISKSFDTLTYNGGGDGYVAKYSSQGVKEWGYYIGGSDDDIVYDLTLDGSGHAYLIGITSSTSLMGSSFSVAETSQVVFVSKIHLQSSSVNWSKQFDVYKSSIEADQALEIRKFEEFVAISIDNQGRLVLGYGYEVAPSRSNTKLLQLNAEGNILWQWQSIGAGSDLLLDLEIDSSNNIIFAGKTTSVDYPLKNPQSYTLSGGNDAFISKLSPSGELLWSSFVGGGLEDVAVGVEVDMQSTVIVCGFTSSFDFGRQNSEVQGLIDLFIVEFPLEVIAGPAQDGIMELVQAFLVESSVFELLMILAGIVIGYRTLSYYWKTRITEFVIFAGIFLSIILSSYLPFLSAITKAQPLADFILFRLPFVGLTFTWVLLLVHAFRLKWNELPRVLYLIGIVLFTVKLVVTIFLFFLPITLTLTRDAQLLVISLGLGGFVLFDLFVLFILLYSYFTVKLAISTQGIEIAFRLWKLAWVFFAGGYLVLLVFTALQLIIFGNISIISQELTTLRSINQLISVYQVLEGVFQSGIVFFIVILATGLIALRYPEGVLLSQSQVLKAVDLYRVYERQGSTPTTPTTLDQYLKMAIKQMDEEDNREVGQ